MAAFPVTANATHDTASPVSFLPDENGTAVSRSDILADRFDGTDNSAHVTAVTNNTPDRVQWRVCPTVVTDAGPGGGGISAAELAQCNIIMGEDTTPNVPGSSGVFASADEAYDILYNVPASLDGQTRDVLVLACVGSGEITDPGAGTVNCQTTLEENTIFDDAETGEPDATTGEMVSYCTADTTGGPGGGGGLAGDPCQFANAVGATQQAQVASRFKPFPHGSPVPNDGFVIRATTSTDVGGEIHGARDYGADSDQDPQTADQTTACTVIQAQADRITWECIFPDAAGTDDDVAQAVWIYNDAGGTAAGPADCSAGGVATQCTLDSHFAVSQARRANGVQQSFVQGGGGHAPAHNPPNPPVTAGCMNNRVPGSGETPVKTHSNNNLGATEEVRICVLDQFSDPFAAPVTEEISGPGTWLGVAGPHDHDGNGSVEHAHDTTHADGQHDFTIGNFNSTPGTVTITSCVDPQNGGTSQAPPTNHGCADAPTNLKDTLTLTYGTQPSEVFLAFNDPAPTNPADPCRTGITFKRNNVGDTDDITVCTYDSNGNPQATDSNNFRIVWEIQGAQGNEPTAVRFEGSPPQETSGSGATASTRVVAEQQGDNFIEVFLLDSNGEVVDDFAIEKQVEGENVPQRINTNVRARKARLKVRGHVSTPQNGQCRANREATLYKRQRGSDRVIGVDFTNDRGRVGIKKGNRRGVFYIRVSQVTRTDPNNGNTLNCLSGQSDDVRYRRRR